MRVFLTGATGFIGSHTLSELLSKGHHVACLIRSGSDIWRIEESLTNSLVTRISGDMESISTIYKSLCEFAPETIIHLAWQGIGADGRNQPEQIYNLAQSLNLLSLAQECGAKNFIGLGSQAEYGPCKAIIGENHVVKPDTLYGLSKLAFSQLAAQACQKNDMRFAWLRLFSAYGPKDSPSWLIPYVVLSLVKNKCPALSPCEQIWDYIHATDVARAIVSAAETESCQGVFNLGSGKAVPLRQIVETVRDAIDPAQPLGFGQMPYREDQVMHLEADISRLTTKTGWQPTIALEKGLHETALWYRDNFMRFEGK